MEGGLGTRKLDGWKAIARYLGRNRATVMRWEVSRGLPVHRLPGTGRATVYAFTEELDAWLGCGSEDNGDPSLADDGGGVTERLGRRNLIAGAIGISALAVLGFQTFRRLDLKSEVDTLLQNARILRGQNTFETQNQAIGLAREAVRIDPRNPDAWGELAYTQAIASRWRTESVSRSLRDQAMINGQHALALDPGNAKGELSLATAFPLLGEDNWIARANGLKRALERAPSDPDVIFECSWILRHTGHCFQSASMCELLEQVDKRAPVYNSWSRALWASGQDEKRDRLISEALRLYPTNKMLWFTNIEMLLFGDIPESAIGIAEDRRNRPTLVQDNEVTEIVGIANTLADKNSAGFDDLITRLKASARTSIRAARNAIRVAAIGGRPDEAFEVIHAHFFGEGFDVGENVGSGLSIPLSQRHTNFLFEPPLAPLWRDRRLEEFFERVGLERFWRISRHPPDFRK